MFFQEQQIDVFSEVSLDNLSDEDRSSIVQFFPAARSVIVFGKEVPVSVYRMPPNEKTPGMLRVAEALDDTAVWLAGLLEEEQVPALPVPLYLPVRIADGRVQGFVRLKQVAAAGGLGSLGRNTVLFNPRFGPRLLLSGVVTGRRVQKSQEAERCRGRKEAPTCTGCGRCINVCPGGALGPEGVDAFRVPDRECLGSPRPRPGCEVDAGTNAIVEMHGPSCTMDRPDGNESGAASVSRSARIIQAMRERWNMTIKTLNPPAHL